MQIRGDYQSYQNNRYEQPRNQYAAEGFQLEQEKKSDGEPLSDKTENVYEQRSARKQDSMELSAMIQSETKAAEERKSGVSLLKGFWDKLGDEENANQGEVPVSVKETVMSGLQSFFDSAKAAIHTVLQQKLLGKLTQLPKNFKTEITAAIRKFGKGKEAFTALSDERMPSGQGGANTGEGQQNGHVAGEGKDSEQMKRAATSHLMDSYSKRGEYCQLNDNLSYRKPVGTGRAGEKRTENQMRVDKRL